MAGMQFDPSRFGFNRANQMTDPFGIQEQLKNFDRGRFDNTPADTGDMPMQNEDVFNFDFDRTGGNRKAPSPMDMNSVDRGGSPVQMNAKAPPQKTPTWEQYAKDKGLGFGSHGIGNMDLDAGSGQALADSSKGQDRLNPTAPPQMQSGLASNRMLPDARTNPAEMVQDNPSGEPMNDIDVPNSAGTQQTPSPQFQAPEPQTPQGSLSAFADKPADTPAMDAVSNMAKTTASTPAAQQAAQAPVDRHETGSFGPNGAANPNANGMLNGGMGLMNMMPQGEGAGGMGLMGILKQVLGGANAQAQAGPQNKTQSALSSALSGFLGGMTGGASPMAAAAGGNPMASAASAMAGAASPTGGQPMDYMQMLQQRISALQGAEKPSGTAIGDLTRKNWGQMLAGLGQGMIGSKSGSFLGALADGSSGMSRAAQAREAQNMAEYQKGLGRLERLNDTMFSTLYGDAKEARRNTREDGLLDDRRDYDAKLRQLGYDRQDSNWQRDQAAINARTNDNRAYEEDQDAAKRARDAEAARANAEARAAREQAEFERDTNVKTNQTRIKRVDDYAKIILDSSKSALGVPTKTPADAMREAEALVDSENMRQSGRRSDNIGGGALGG